MIDDPTHKHHDGLPNNQVRDLLAVEVKNHEVAQGLYGVDEFRDFLVKEVEKAKRVLAAYDKGRGLKAILAQFGWKEHDISDYVEYDKETYHGFIGTDEERKTVYPESKRRR